MDEKVLTWKERLAEAKLALPVRDHPIMGTVLDAEDRTIVRNMDPFWAPIIVEAFKNAERYDKIRRYIRAGTVSQLFPWGDGSKWPEAITEQDMLNVVDNHIDELPENWYKP